MRKLISAVTLCAMAVSMVTGFAVTASAAETINSFEGLQKAVKSGGSYILTDDIKNVTASLKLGSSNKSFELDMNGYDIEANVTKVFDLSGDLTGSIVIKNSSATESIIYTTKDYLMNLNSGKYDISNVTLKTDSGQTLLFGSSGGEVAFVMNDCKVFGATYGINVAKPNSNIEINNTNVTVTQGPAVASTAGNITINGGSYTRTEGAKNYILNLGGTSNVVLNNPTVTTTTSEGAAIQVVKGSTGTITVNGGKYSNTASSKNYVILDSTESDGATVNINNGVFNGIIQKADKNKADINVMGGTYDDDPTSYVDTTAYDVTKADSKWTVSKKQTEAKPVVTSVDGGVTNAGDGYKSAVYKVDATAHGTKNRIAVTVEGSKEGTQYKDIGTFITDSDVIFAVILIGSDDTEFPTNITAEFVD
ncbi:MAG: hypothetical protein SOS24_04680 [Clostridia bacterium]|nr:hypothetical protein [Clostridia bacterium]